MVEILFFLILKKKKKLGRSFPRKSGPGVSVAPPGRPPERSAKGAKGLILAGPKTFAERTPKKLNFGLNLSFF